MVLNFQKKKKKKNLAHDFVKNHNISTPSLRGPQRTAPSTCITVEGETGFAKFRS